MLVARRLRGYQHFSSVILPLFGRSNEMLTFLTMLIRQGVERFDIDKIRYKLKVGSDVP